MKKPNFLYLALLVIPLAFPLIGTGQDFLNGSFEKNGNLCLINASPSVFNANVKNTFAFGNFRLPDIAGPNCGHGFAKDGNWFVGLVAGSTSKNPSEIINLELSGSLRKGSKYSLTFWAKQRPIAPDIELGLCNIDSLEGQIFNTVSHANIGAEWTEVTVVFTAPNNGNFISVRASSPGQISGVWLDGFEMNEIVQASNPETISKTLIIKNNAGEIPKSNFRNEISFFPNPSEGLFKVNAESSDLASIVVYNMLGSPVQDYLATENQIVDRIDLTEEQPGMYFVELAMLNGQKVIKRIVVSRHL
jgi:hypothetical protein